VRGTLALLLLCATPAAAAFDANGVALGDGEAQVKAKYPSARCKPLEWKSDAADRRCDDGRIQFGGTEARVTFFLRAGVVEAFEVRFPTREAARVEAYLKSHYGRPSAELEETHQRKGGTPRVVRKVRWEEETRRAVFVTRPEKSRSELSAWRGTFDEEIYRVK
jgi:hypothetical protein